MNQCIISFFILSGVNNWADSLLIYQEAGATQQEVSAEAQELMGIMLEIRQLRRMNAAFALPLVNALPDTNVLESNRKIVYQVYLTAAAQGTTHLTSAQFDLISDIAHQCPLEGGSGVFLARALYQYNDRKHFDDEMLCGTEERGLPAANLSAFGLTIAPNPASEMVDVRLLPKKAGQQASVQIFNITGQQVSARSVITEESGTIRLDISALPDGMYFCEVTLPGNLKQSAKLLIQH